VARFAPHQFVRPRQGEHGEIVTKLTSRLLSLRVLTTHQKKHHSQNQTYCPDLNEVGTPKHPALQ
jgi:hypothetical protein